MQTINFLFEDGGINNPFTVKESDTYSVFRTTEFYLQSMKQKSINQETDLLIQIELYIDETVLDRKAITSSSCYHINDIQYIYSLFIYVMAYTWIYT